MLSKQELVERVARVLPAFAEADERCREWKQQVVEAYGEQYEDWRRDFLEEALVRCRVAGTSTEPLVALLHQFDDLDPARYFGLKAKPPEQKPGEPITYCAPDAEQGRLDALIAHETNQRYGYSTEHSPDALKIAQDYFDGAMSEPVGFRADRKVDQASEQIATLEARVKKLERSVRWHGNALLLSVVPAAALLLARVLGW